jgi:hypothetical protein
VILLVVPGVTAVVASLAAALLHRRLRPAVAVPVLTALSTMSALAVLWSLALLVVGFVGHVAWVSERAGWCRALAHAHDAIPPAVGIAAFGALAASVLSIIRHERRRPRLHAPLESDHELVVLPDAEPTAYALPGKPGHIVVSVGMIRALDGAERQVLLAHERAHLRHGHHRYRRVADLVAAAVPLLRPISDRVRFATERWADEVAADAVGDRTLAARAITRAALATTSAGITPALAMAALGVPARVNALLDEQPAGRRRMTALTVTSLVALVTVAGSTVQFHHLLAFASRLCGD